MALPSGLYHYSLHTKEDVLLFQDSFMVEAEGGVLLGKELNVNMLEIADVSAYISSSEIVIRNPLQKQMMSVEVFSLLGQQCYHHLLDSNDVEVRLPYMLLPGTYLLRINTLNSLSVILFVHNMM